MDKNVIDSLNQNYHWVKDQAYKHVEYRLLNRVEKLVTTPIITEIWFSLYAELFHV